MQISNKGLEFIKKNEGFQAKAYPDAGGYSIGYGTFLYSPQLMAKYKNTTITKEEGEALMVPNLQTITQEINQHVKVPLTQNQFDALADFCYNLGCDSLTESILLKLLNQKNYQNAAIEFGKWIHSEGVIVPGLVARRNEEKELFSSGT